ncbi:MAG: P1 family peptidase [Deltaproteobacteria bacterium]|nr:P1 family peptidase [Deltaproteobacteria bacterium]
MGSITDVSGVRVGHASDFEAITGCTVILFDKEATGAIDLRGGGTSTRQIDGLLPYHSYGRIHGILLTGGSAYGLDAAAGVMKYLEEQGIGLDVGYGEIVPSVPTAVVFDLGIGNGKVRPDAEMGYRACLAATSLPVQEGSIGVGTGATIGKIFGVQTATKGGVGAASYSLENGTVIGVIVVVNAFGDVVDPQSGEIIAGVRNSHDAMEFIGSVDLFKRGFTRRFEPFENTTLAVIATNAKFSKLELMRIARIGQTGITRVIAPSHTISDGDLVFAVSCGNHEGDANAVGIIAAELISESIVRAVKAARSLGGIPSWSDIRE